MTLRPQFARLLWLLGAVLLAFHFSLNLQQSGRVYLDSAAYVQLAEKRPYQYRVLMAPVLGVLVQALGTAPARRVLDRLPRYVSTPEAGAYVVIDAVAFTVSCLLIAAIARRVLGGGMAVPLLLSVYLALVYLFLCLNPNVAFILPYDLPSLALSQACLLAVLDRRWLRLAVLFVLATLNRETSLLVVVFIAVQALSRRDPPGAWLGRVAVLCVLWLLLKTGLYLAFRALPSDEGLRLAYNLRTLVKPWQWPALLPLLASLALSLPSLRLAQREWAVTGCIGFALVFLVGQITETRAFAELATYFAVAIALWLARHQSPAWSRMPP